jgi:hypothetical protein
MAMKYSIAIVVLLPACQITPPEGEVTEQVASCGSPRDFGAIPDDGVDDRVALQAVLNACAGTTVSLEAGQYEVVTPSPRSVAMLTLPAGTTLQGLGTQSVVRFSGDNGTRDWRGIQLGNSTLIQRLRLVTDFAPGTTDEQTHVIRGDGPLHDVTVTDVAINHPSHQSKSGDCIQFVGYPPTDTSPDKRIWNANVNHVNFERCDRSGIAVHSGLHGSLVAGHLTSRFNANTFTGISDQDIDFEGSGDIDGVEIDNNTFLVPANLESTVAVSIVASSNIHFHDNHLDRALDLYGCSQCEIDHNVVSLAIPASEPVVNLRKRSSNVVFHDEIYTRAASAGIGAVLAITQKISAPDHVTVADSQLIQHSNGVPLIAVGIIGLQVLRDTITYDGADGLPLRIDGIVATGSSGDGSLRTTDLHVVDTVINGPIRAAMGVSGSYAGTGTVELTRVRASGANQGLRCEGIATGAGITGPVTYVDNQLPPAVCSPLVP